MDYKKKNLNLRKNDKQYLSVQKKKTVQKSGAVQKKFGQKKL